jgi:predicted thioesterase
VPPTAPEIPRQRGSIAPVIKNAGIEHRRATPVGGSVEITATAPRDVAGSRLTFRVQATDGWGEVVAVGEIDRAIVDRQRFLASVDTGH